MSSEDTQLPLASPDPVADLAGQLRAAAPQVFSDGKVDFERLRAALGDQIDTGQERYGLNWAGKADAFRNVRAPAIGTLLPMPDASVNWDRTENLIIEGDNLEVLKLLQKPYHGRVKMIYIDPPYNTGNDFIYPDNYRQGLDDYLRFSGQVSAEGLAQSSNRESSGRYHSDWLSMMYPRLFLARNLLRDDGVIFVSIDDNEVHNLRMLMNEVFGEENFIATVIWQKKYSTKADSKYFSESHEYLLVYGRNISSVQIHGLSRTDEQESIYKNPDNDSRGPWTSDNLLRTEERAYAIFEIIGPNQQRYLPPKGSSWRFNKDKIEELIRDNRIWFGEKGDSKPRLKRFRSEVRNTIPPQTFWSFDHVGHTDEGTKSLAALFGGTKSPFPNPKPSRLLSRCVAVSVPADGIVLDFFSGSGTTAQSVLELNQQDGGNRKFILVQLPEKIDSTEHPTIAHITRERVRRVITKLDKEDETKKSSRGFRAFKLSSSNFRIWNAEQTPDDPAKLAEQLQLYADNSGHARSEQDVLYELILKSGLPLSCRVAPVTVAGASAWSVDDCKLLILLNKYASREVLRAMIALQPQQIVCLDATFNGDDALKTSIVLEAKSHGVAFRTV